MVLYLFVEALWFILPAYAANGLATLPKGSHPIDRGKTFRDRPLFGPGKTWEGLIFGCIVAAFVGFVQMAAMPNLPFGISPVPLMIVDMTPLLGLLLGLGAMAGDIAGSFAKRRLGIPKGNAAPILDQTDFLFGAFLFAVFLVPLKWQWFLLLFVITPVLHLIANIIAYVLGIKNRWY